MTPLPRPYALIATLACAAAIACNSVPPPATAPPAAPAVSGSAALPAGPRIVGTVLSAMGDPLRSGAVVYLEDAPKQPGMATTATVDVHNKDFSPLIAVVTTGGTVTFGNRDNLTHHVFSPDVQQWDTGYLQKGDTATRIFSAPGAIALLCNIHPEMIGYVLTIPSSYFGQVGTDGRYVIAGAPPGTYKATLWVPRTPPVTQSVTVGASGSVTANFKLVNPPEK